MEKLILSKISLTDLKRFITLQEGVIASHPWIQVDSMTLTDHEQQQIQDLKRGNRSSVLFRPLAG